MVLHLLISLYHIGNTYTTPRVLHQLTQKWMISNFERKQLYFFTGFLPWGLLSISVLYLHYCLHYLFLRLFLILWHHKTAQSTTQFFYQRFRYKNVTTSDIGWYGVYLVLLCKHYHMLQISPTRDFLKCPFWLCYLLCLF